jgi:hypothetical protein
VTTGVELIAAKRATHASKGFDTAHDLEHGSGELAKAAQAYLEGLDSCRCPVSFPWHKSEYKPTLDDPINQLAKAGSLIAAEIDRLLLQQELKQ